MGSGKYIPSGLHRASAHGKGAGNRRGYEHANGWPQEQEEWLRAQVSNPDESYGQLRDRFNAAFPGAGKTRNAILGKCSRLGIRSAKAPGGVVGQKRPETNKRRKGADKRITLAKQAPIVSSPPTAVSDAAIGLRNEGDLAIQGRGNGQRHLSSSRPDHAAEIAERRVGSIPDISGEAGATAKPLMDCTKFECKWPISWSPVAMGCGKKAIVGAYCAGHARLAFRVMPTRKRNAKAYGR